MRKRGFSLIELLVVVAVLAVVFVVLTVAINNLFRSEKTVKGSEAISQERVRLMHHLIQDVRWSKGYELVEGGGDFDNLKLNKLESANEEVVVYEVRTDGAIWRDGKRLTSRDVTVTRFNVEQLNTADQVPMIRVWYGMESREGGAATNQDESVTLSMRKQIDLGGQGE